MIQEKKMAQAKAREISIAAAKAKAGAERSYRKMIWENNKICGQCAVGSKRIKQRRAEIEIQNKQAKTAHNVRKTKNEKAAHKSAMDKQQRSIKKIQKKIQKI